MASVLNTLNIGYSGLTAAQVGINTTSHNISNAESDGYTRQRVITAAAQPLNGRTGNGVQILEIERIFDNFVFDRFASISSDKEYSEFEKKTLEELSTYFPEIDGVGIKADLVDYYDMWQTLADNSDNDSIKLALAEQAQTLSDHIRLTQNQVLDLQKQVNDELAVNINEVNSLTKELANINQQIDVAEAGGGFTANDLRDKRNVIERDLSRLIGATANSGQMESNIQISNSSNIVSGSYTINVGGFNIVDGSSYHPIHISSKQNPNGFYEMSFERQDAVLIPMEDNIKRGRIGAILDLRGGTIDSTTGVPNDGILQNTIAQLDSFAKNIIESTNNLYANTATTKMESNVLDITPTNSLVNSTININEGSFDIIIYNIDGDITARRNIVIDSATVMTGPIGSNSIQGQIGATVDDNNDNSANNDIDDFIQFNWATYGGGETALELAMDPLSKSRGYHFSIEDVLPNADFSSGTNFAGALGLNRFFDGEDARDMNLNLALKANPTIIFSGSAPLAGDNNVALNMVQHQFEEYKFDTGTLVYSTTTYGMFDILATEVGTATNSAILRNETVSAQFNATELAYSSVSKVSIDEEMTNLIKYQTAYSASAKVITTIDQMMQTLLGMKQ